MDNPLKPILSSLYAFVNMYPASRLAMTNLWFHNSARDIALAFQQTDGIKLIVSSSDLNNLKSVAYKLMLVSDSIAIRDTRSLNEDSGGVIFPEWCPYDVEKLKQKVSKPVFIRPLSHFEIWSSTMLEVPGIGKYPIAMSIFQRFDDDVYEWIFGDGRKYHESGDVFYAPFIPPLDVELEFMKHGVSLSEGYGGESLYSQQYDYFDRTALTALASIDFPTLNGVNKDDLIKLNTIIMTSLLTFRGTL